MTLLPAQLQTFTLAGSGAIIGEQTITLQSFNSIDGIPLAMADFGTIGFATIEPNSGTQEEQISFTGVTQNANGTATLTGVKSVLFLSPYTSTVGLTKTHSGGVKFVISNTSAFYAALAASKVSGFGSWASITADGVAHLVAADGFLVVQAVGTGSGCETTILTDSSNPPTTVRAVIKNSNSDGGNATVPVKAGDYYKITTSGGTTVAYLIPLSNS